ncbi:MAG: alpha-amylase, partial [Chitinophagaceae bacterium]
MTTTNPTMLQFFEWYCQGGGRHWSHLESQVPFIKESGFSSVWLPPAYKGTRGPTSEGYDVYDIYDLGEFDQKGSVATKYGTRQQYIDACSAVRSAGLNLIVDIVLNHMG